MQVHPFLQDPLPDQETEVSDHLTRADDVPAISSQKRQPCARTYKYTKSGDLFQ